MLLYRVHSADESTDTVLDASRPDGWVAGDESVETQPHGVSCCDSLENLRRYIRTYSMSVRPGDRVLVMSGAVCGQDRDDWATRGEIEEIIETLPLSALYDHESRECPCCGRRRCHVCAPALDAAEEE